MTLNLRGQILRASFGALIKLSKKCMTEFQEVEHTHPNKKLKISMKPRLNQEGNSDKKDHLS